MKRKNVYRFMESIKMSAIVALTVLSACILGAPGASADSAVGVSVSPPGGTEKSIAMVSEDTSRSAGGHAEGVQVHGHWTIEVREPNGTLVHRREFENAITSTGQLTLARILSRNYVFGNWRINFAGVSCNSYPCDMGESTDADTTTGVVKNLAVTENSDGITLNGSNTVTTAGDITTVRTLNAICSATGAYPSPADCITAPFGGAGSSLEIFTETSLSPVIPVLSGQVVQVTVILSFS